MLRLLWCCLDRWCYDAAKLVLSCHSACSHAHNPCRTSCMVTAKCEHCVAAPPAGPISCMQTPVASPSRLWSKGELRDDLSAGASPAGAGGDRAAEAPGSTAPPPPPPVQPPSWCDRPMPLRLHLPATDVQVSGWHTVGQLLALWPQCKPVPTSMCRSGVIVSTAAAGRV